MPSETMADLRAMMFEQARKIKEQLAAGKPLDLKAERLQMEICLGIVESAKVEVELAAIVKGALDVPFIEMQTTERLPDKEPQKQLSAPVEPLERVAQVLGSGPSASHPWRPRAVPS